MARLPLPAMALKVSADRVGLCFWTVGTLILLWGLCLPASFAQPQNHKEYYVKAGFIVNFARLIEWPHAMPEIVICVMDPEPFGTALAAMEKKQIQNKPITVKVCGVDTDYSGIHILFMNSQDEKIRKKILEKIENRPVLTIGETPGFARHEGVINFYKYQNKLRFEINPKKAERIGLKISSRLLRLARIVEGDT